MDDFLKGLGKLLSTLQLGNVAEWVGSIITAGTLFLGLMILWRDRRRSVRAMADGFVTWITTTMSATSEDDKRYTVKVYAHNTTDSPIPVAIIRSKADSKHTFIESFREHGEDWDIAPKTKVMTEIEMTIDPIELPIVIHFIDARNKQWYRDLHTGKYLSERQFNRLRKPLAGWQGRKKNHDQLED